MCVTCAYLHGSEAWKNSSISLLVFNFIFSFQRVLVFVSFGSISVGAFGALKQVRIKRFLAYTSINQVGFILLGVACCNLAGIVATLIYIVFYAIMSVVFFAMILNIEHVVTRRTMLYLSDLSSISLNNSELGGKYLIIVILSMGGLPPTGGFFGKVLIYFAAMEARLDFIVFLSLCLSVISTYYYLSLIQYLCFERRRVLKLFLYKRKVVLDSLLQILSMLLLFAFVGLPYSFLIITSLALSCLCPIIWN